MIATRPSDLRWQSGPLPAPDQDLVLLVWIAGVLANHFEKAFTYEGRWTVYYHVPIEAFGTVRFWAVLRDEPYCGYVPLATNDPTVEAV